MVICVVAFVWISLLVLLSWAWQLTTPKLHIHGNITLNDYKPESATYRGYRNQLHTPQQVLIQIQSTFMRLSCSLNYVGLDILIVVVCSHAGIARFFKHTSHHACEWESKENPQYQE
jgi:hypothetical protein